LSDLLKNVKSNNSYDLFIRYNNENNLKSIFMNRFIFRQYEAIWTIADMLITLLRLNQEWGNYLQSRRMNCAFIVGGLSLAGGKIN